MDDMFRQIARYADRVRLTDDERAAMRSRLMTLTETMPVMRDVPAAPKAKRGLFDRLRFPAWSHAKAVPVFGLVAALALSAGGTAFAAEGSLPGDALYPVKVHVIEEVQGALAVTPEAKAEWASARAARRLDEAEKLAARGTLTAKTGAGIAQNFKRFAADAQQRIAALQSGGDDEAAAHASSGFEAALSAHERILATLAQTKIDKNSSDVAALAATVETATKDSENVRVRTEQQMGRSGTAKLEQAAKERQGAAQRKIDAASSVVDAAGASAGAKSELTAAKAAFDAGKTHLAAGEYAQAFSSFQSASRAAQQSVLLVNAQTELHVRIGADAASANGEQGDHGESEASSAKNAAATSNVGTGTSSAPASSATTPFVGTGKKITIPGLVGAGEDDVRIGSTSSGVGAGGDDRGERENEDGERD